MAAPLAQVFDLDRIQKLAGVRRLAVASMIREDAIEGLEEQDGRLTATVRGTMPYAVAIWVEGTRKAAYSCTCPQGDDGKFCKHAAAVALTLHGGGRSALRPPRQPATPVDVESDPVFDYLLGLDHRELAHLVYDAATRDPRTAQRLEAAIAADTGQPAVDVKEWRKAITAAFGRPSHYVDYREAPRWADGVHDVLHGLRGLVDDGQAEAVIRLVEYAFERADKATGHVDSSDGCFEGISYDISDIHLNACLAARPDPEALARRLVEFDLHAELDTFRRAAATYADVLGPTGLAEYRRLVEPAYDALGPRSDNAWSTERFHLTDAMIGLALATDDADEVIRIKERDLRSPRDYEEIVAVLERNGRTDEAIDWARRGIAMPGRSFQTHHLRDQLVAILTARGDTVGAEQERLRGFQDSPSLTAYKALLATTDEADRDRQRSGVYDWLRARAVTTDGTAAGSVLVEILLYEGHTEDAWDAATTLGCDQRWWMTLARAREKDHPADAIPIYQDAVSELIDRKKSNAYKDAVDLMARIQHLYDATDAPDGWDAYLSDVVAKHRPKRNLMGRMHDRGWQ